MARRLDRAASTVGREVTRHGGRPAYRAHEADDQAWESALRPKKCLLAMHRRLREVVAGKLIPAAPGQAARGTPAPPQPARDRQPRLPPAPGPAQAAAGDARPAGRAARYGPAGTEQDRPPGPARPSPAWK